MSVLREPALLVLMAVIVTQLWRQSWVDSAVFIAAALVIVIDHGRWPRRLALPRPLVGSRPWIAGAVVIGSLLVGAALATLPRTSAQLSLALAVPGIVAAVLALRRPRGVEVGRPAPPSPDADDVSDRGRGWLLWVGVALTLALIELTMFLGQPDPKTGNEERPTLSVIVEPWFDSALARAVGIAVWLCCGWWLVRRIRAVTRSA